MPSLMKAIQFKRFGGPEVLELVEVPILEPAENEVLIKIHVSGVNFVDIYMRKNEYFREVKLPCTPGVEAVGTVQKLGSSVKGIRPGARVGLHHTRGTYAEYVTSTISSLIPLPGWINDETAVVLPVQGLTAYHLLHTAHTLKKNDWVLVHAAAGGVGMLAVQMAKLLGARVIGTTSSKEKARWIREMGADEVILYTQKDFAIESRRITGGRGVSLVLDAVGKSTLSKSLEACAPLGHVILYGWASGKPAPVDPLSLLIGSKNLSGLAVRDANRDPRFKKRALQKIFQWIKDGKLKLAIKSFPLESAAQAQQELESRKTVGKLVLKS